MTQIPVFLMNHNFNMSSSFKTGFTIIEIIFIVIVLGILITIIYPDFYSYFIHKDFETTFAVIRNFISTARDNQINLSKSNWSVNITNNEVRLLNNNNVVDKYRYFNKYILLASSDTEIVFNKDGTTVKPAGYKILLRRGSNTFELKVNNMTGYIEVNKN